MAPQHSWFVRNAEHITRWSYTLATTILIAKNIVEPLLSGTRTPLDVLGSLPGMMDIVAAAAFYYSSTMFGRAKANPDALKRAGWAILVASTALIIGGWRGSFGDNSFWLQATSMLPTAFAGLCFTTNIQSKRLLGAVPELLSRPVHAAAGILQGDFGQVLFSLSGALAETALIATDYRLKAEKAAAKGEAA